MYHLSPSTVSLNPVFPGHYPATPARAKPEDLYDDDHDEENCKWTEHSSPSGHDIKDAYTDNDGDISGSSEDDDALGFSPEAPSISVSSACSFESVEPASSIQSESEETDSGSVRSVASNASTINHLRPSVLDHGASSSGHYRVSNLPSIRSEVSTSLQDRMVHLGDPRFPSTLSLGVDLVGLPSPQLDHGQGVFLDGDSHYYGVDLSCLSQPDGSNAWTLTLGPGSPFPSVSTSDETPQSGISSTFSSPGISTSATTHGASSPSTPSSNLDYFGMESGNVTPSSRTEALHHYEGHQCNDYVSTPLYEQSSLILESVPYSQHLSHPAPEEPKRPFKEVIEDVKKLGSKLKKIWKTRPQLALPHFKTKAPPPATEVAPVEREAEEEPYAPPSTAYTTVPMRTSLEGPRGDYSWRTPPGLAQLVEEEEEDLVSEHDTTPKMADSRRKLFKPQTIAEIKHVRRRTLPAAPLEDFSADTGSPIINISARRPRPRSLVFTTSAGTSSQAEGRSTTSGMALTEGHSSSTISPPFESRPLQYPELGQPALEDSSRFGSTSSRRRKRWSMPLSLFAKP